MSKLHRAAPCMWMRGGTSKGGYFLNEDLPADPGARDAFLLSIMGSPNERQIDGMGGADPLTSKVAIVQKSEREGVDVDYFFLQVAVDTALVSDAQNCGNLLAGVGPFAIERGIIAAENDKTRVSIFMRNSGQTAVATVSKPDKTVSYEGDASIDGVPGTSASILLAFEDIAGSTCGALLPSGNEVDTIDDIAVTMIDNGMPCVIMLASDMGISGAETREELEANADLRTRLEAIRLKAGILMNLGDVTDKTVPKMTMVSAPKSGGAISTRTFIPHRCHASIGVLGAVSVATACLLKGAPVTKLARIPEGAAKELQIEHPIGETTIVIQTAKDGSIKSTSILRTARKLFDGVVFAR